MVSVNILKFLLPVISLITFSSSTLGEVVGAPITEDLAKVIPRGKLISSVKCNLGPDGIESFGLLIENPDAKKGENALDPYIALKRKEWVLVKISRRLDYERGREADFLEEFWSEKGLVVAPEIRCTSPKRDKDMVDQQGFFVKGAKSMLPDAKHICFSSSVTYSNWTCFTLMGKDSSPEVSFVQMNAD